MSDLSSTAATTPRKSVISWAFYDWANSAFATTVMAGLFPIFYNDFYHAGAPGPRTTFELGAFNSTAGLLIAVCAPLLGAIADRGGRRKRFLLGLATLGAIATGSLYFVEQGHWQAAGICYVLGVMGFLGANIFYDAMIVDVARGRNSDKISALGYSMGYLGGGILFAINVAMALNPEWFGISSASNGVRIAFISVAVWWLLFSIPLALNVKEAKCEAPCPIGQAVREGLTQLKSTFRQIRKLKNVFTFLIAYWLYIDGVDTIIVMATKLGRDLNFPASDLIKALLVVQFVGFPAAIFFGYIGQKIGTKRGIYIALAVYTVVTFIGYSMTTTRQFFMLAIMIGLVQGGVQSLSRSYYSRLIPQDKAAEFFGFYNMLGKFASIIGPMLMGTVSLITGNSRAGILALVILFAAGAVVLFFVKEERATLPDGAANV